MTKCVTNRINLYTPSFKTLLVLLFLSVLSLNSYGQNYGLGISTPDFVQENNTSLDLSPINQICLDGNFEISFDISALRPSDYNGYIVRIIEDNDRNFDLIYNILNIENPFQIIIGDHGTKINFNILPDHFYKQWNKITIKFNTDEGILIVSDGHRSYVQGGLRLKKRGCYKLLFGANRDKVFKTNLALAAKYRNIRIINNGIIKYHWPLDEHHGEVAHELINGKNGRVKNPFWIASTHQNWKRVAAFSVKGLASTAFDSKGESLFIIGQDSLFTFSLRNAVLSATSNQGKIEAELGTQSIYNPVNNKLYNFVPYLQKIGRYSITNQKWDKKLPLWNRTDYFYATKVISQRDNSMYVFGGFNAFKFKNEVKRLSLETERWEDVKPNGDSFTPSYLSALGSNRQGDTIYLLGGYGSANGSEMVNPKHIYNMMRFTTKDKTFRKLYDLKNEGEDFVFASSLVIDSSSKTYYGLVFPHDKNNSHLRLIKGSLKNSSFKYIGSAFPYRFYGDFSFADLYYCPDSKKFVAVTLLVVVGFQTQVKIYTLEGPPLEVLKSSSPAKHYTSSWLFIGLAIFVALLCGGLVLYLHRRKRHISTDDQIEDLEPHKKLSVSHRNTIFLFGDFQIFDRDGADITKLFTPLLKELFLLLLVNSVKNGRGLYAEKLDEILWFGRSEQSVRNNRSVNMAKLKSILESIEHCQLLKEAGYWKLEFDYEFWYVDYHSYLDLIQAKEKHDEQHIRLLFELAQRGNFLSNHNYEWLDQFKAEISNEVIDVFLIYAHSAKAHNPEFLIQIANFVFNFDQVSEEAMIIKCRALSSLGKHSLAKKAFDVFIKDYRLIYNEDFNKNFNEIIQT